MNLIQKIDFLNQNILYPCFCQHICYQVIFKYMKVYYQSTINL